MNSLHIHMKGKHMKYMKKIGAILLLAGLIAGAVMAEAKSSMGKADQIMTSRAASMTAKKHRKHRKHRKTASKTASSRHGK
jgi:tRNA splicing ligase